MNLTSEQTAAVRFADNVCLVSCPGSGKTRTIVAKLIRCIEEVRGSTRRVAGVTHTNAAADEIDGRVRRTCFSGEQSYYDVSTIHSFALQHVLTPFHRLLPEFRDGFEILTSEDERYVAQLNEICAKYEINRRRAEDFDIIQRALERGTLVPQGFPEVAALEWFSWLDNSSYVSLSDIVFHSCRLVENYEFIASALASRYAWILVDEFQDSSFGQLFLLKKIYSHGRTRFFCVGDPNQSIYGFAGANPAVLSDFATHVAATEDLRLSGNFRSSAKIVEVAEMLIPTNPPMHAVGGYRDYDFTPIRHHVAEPLEGLLATFLPAVKTLGVPFGEVAVMAPWWTNLLHLSRGLRTNGYPVIGPGARPYKRDNVFSRLAESVGAYLESPEPEIALSVQRALFITMTELAGEPVRSVYTYQGRVIICELLASADAARQLRGDAEEWLELAAEKFTEILLRAQLLPQPHRDSLVESAAKMQKEIRRYRDEDQPIAVEDLGIFARPRNCIHLLTIHRAKGREYEAVAIVDAHDGKLPHYLVRYIPDIAKRQEAYEEARRVMYVATTRAKRLLMYFTDSADDRNRPSPFLAPMGLL